MSTGWAASPSELLMRAATRAAGRRRSAVRRRLTLIAGLAMLGIAVAAILFAPVLVSQSPTTIDALHPLAPPLTPGHLLGTDQFGRDLLARVAVGYRVSLFVALGSVLLGLVVGVPLGLVSATSHKSIDGPLMRVMDVFMAFPLMLLAIVVVAIVGTGTLALMLAIGLGYIPVLARVMRAQAMETSKESFVEAARARGASYWRLIVRHIGANSMGPVIVQATILIAVSIILEAGLSFVGLGVQPPTPSLGLMLATGRDFMATSSWQVIAPGVAILVAVLAFTLLGDGLQDWLDPKRRVIGR